MYDKLLSFIEKQLILSLKDLDEAKAKLEYWIKKEERLAAEMEQEHEPSKE